MDRSDFLGTYNLLVLCWRKGKVNMGVTNWLMEHIADRIFSSVVEKAREFVSSTTDSDTVQKIQQVFFEKYGGDVCYNYFDKYISTNHCIESAVRLARSTTPKDQYAFAHFVDDHTRRFIETNSKQKWSKDSVREKFEFIKQTALEFINQSSDANTRQLQVSIMQGTQDIQNTVDNVRVAICEKIEQMPLQVLNAAQESFQCNEKDLQPYFDQVENIMERLQKNQQYNAAVQEYNSCYQAISTKLKFKSGKELDNLYCKILCNIAICYANMGNFKRAKDSLQVALDISRNKTVRNTYSAIALQTKDDEMYEQAILFMNTNLKENPNDIDSFLYIQIFTVLLDETKYEHVMEELDSKRKVISNKSALENYFEFKALIERLCGHYEQAIRDFEYASENGYDNILTRVNIAFIYYSMAVEDMEPTFCLNPKPKWDKLLICYNELNKLLKCFPENDLRYLIIPQILKVYLNCCIIFQKNNFCYLRQDLVSVILNLDYESIRAFVLTTPVDIIKEKNFLEKLNEVDRILWNIQQQISRGNYEDAEAQAYYVLQSGLCLHPVLVYDVLLQISLSQHNFDKYVKYRDEMISKGMITPSYPIMEACYSELLGKIEEAKVQIDNLVTSSKDFGDLENSLRFYWRNNFENNALQTIKLILERKRNNLIYITHPEAYYSSIFKFTLDNDFKLCCEIIESIDSTEISEKLLLQMQLDISTIKNDLPMISILNDKIYNLTHRSIFLINSASAKFNLGDYNSSEEILQRLSYSKLSQDERWYYNLLYSKIELLKTSYEKAFKYAQLAHEDNMDRPKHPSHSYYFSIAFRCGHIEEGLKDTLMFKKDNPVAVDYIKEIPSLVTDDAGNESLTQEFWDFLNEHKKATAEWHNYYQKGILGIYQIADFETGCDYAGLISQILSVKDKKIKTFDGDIRCLCTESDLLNKSSNITVDVFSLIAMAYFDLLNLLDLYENVYIGYRTFSFIQEYFITNESSSKIYQLVYSWLAQSKNCVKCPDGPIDFEDNLKSIFPIHLLGAINVAQQKKSPLLYGDFLEAVVLKKIGSLKGCTVNLVSINSLINTIEDKTYARKIRCQLMKYVSFVNFDTEDILYWIELNQKVTFSVVERFMICSSDVDFMSFAKVYRSTLVQLKNINQVWAKTFALELIKNAEKVRKRATYYEMTVESVIKGKVSKSLPYVRQHIQKYKEVVKYTALIDMFIRQLFPEDLEICESLKSINTYSGINFYLLNLLDSVYTSDMV